MEKLKGIAFRVDYSEGRQQYFWENSELGCEFKVKHGKIPKFFIERPDIHYVLQLEACDPIGSADIISRLQRETAFVMKKYGAYELLNNMKDRRRRLTERLFRAMQNARL